MTETVPQEQSTARPGRFRLWPHLAGAGAVAIACGIVAALGTLVTTTLSGQPLLAVTAGLYNLLIWTMAASIPALIGWLPLYLLFQHTHADRLPRLVRNLTPGAVVGIAVMWLAAEGLPSIGRLLAGAAIGLFVGYTGEKTVRWAQSRAKIGFDFGLLIGILVLGVAVMSNFYLQQALHN